MDRASSTKTREDPINIFSLLICSLIHFFFQFLFFEPPTPIHPLFLFHPSGLKIIKLKKWGQRGHGQFGLTDLEPPSAVGHWSFPNTFDQVYAIVKTVTQTKFFLDKAYGIKLTKL